MTPKEKAEELVTSYASFKITTLGCGAFERNPCIIQNAMFTQSAKACALIAVNEIISNDGFTRHDDSLTEYWQEVKQEIENL